MADVLMGSSERRVLISGGYGLPPESLLCRLDQIDLRLRQLEEQHRPAAHADDCDVVRRSPPAQHQHTKSLPSALQHVQLRGTLMDRLNLLESRIRQLSCELDLDAGKAAAGSYATSLGLGSSSSDVEPQPPAEDRAWSESAPMLEPCREPAPLMSVPDKSSAVADGSWNAVEILQKGARQLHRNKPNPSNKGEEPEGNEMRVPEGEEEGRAQQMVRGRMLILQSRIYCVDELILTDRLNEAYISLSSEFFFFCFRFHSKSILPPF